MNVVSLLKVNTKGVMTGLGDESIGKFVDNMLEFRDKWYEHLPERAIENEQLKVLWDFNIQTDHTIEVRWPDLVIIDEEKKQVHIIDFAVPFDSRVVEKEKENIEKYQDLA